MTQRRSSHRDGAHSRSTRPGTRLARALTISLPHVVLAARARRDLVSARSRRAPPAARPERQVHHLPHRWRPSSSASSSWSAAHRPPARPGAARPLAPAGCRLGGSHPGVELPVPELQHEPKPDLPSILDHSSPRPCAPPPPASSVALAGMELLDHSSTMRASSSAQTAAYRSASLPPRRVPRT